jgi:hypothetical protein
MNIISKDACREMFAAINSRRKSWLLRITERFAIKKGVPLDYSGWKSRYLARNAAIASRATG